MSVCKKIDCIKKSIYSSFSKLLQSYGESSKEPSTFISFPFCEQGFEGLIISPYFIRDDLWTTFTTQYLSGRTMINSVGFTAPWIGEYGFCEVESLPDSDLPFQWTDTILLNQMIYSGDNAKIYKATIRFKEDKHSHRLECAVKVINIRSCSPFWKWNESRKSIPSSSSSSCRLDKLRCCTAWLESIALSKVYPLKFLGTVTFFNRDDTSWYCAIFMPWYKGTFFSLLHKVLDRVYYNGIDTRLLDSSQPLSLIHNTLLAQISQVVLYSIPFAKRSHLISHNDLKVDNIGYKKTKKQFLYVKIHPTREETISLAIPTFGKKFQLIDFGWSSLVCEKEGLKLCSTCPQYNLLDTKMRVWNPYSDFAQFSYSTLNILEEHFHLDIRGLYSGLGPDWWNILDALIYLGSINDGKQILNITNDNWLTGFYSTCSQKCHFERALDFIRFINNFYRWSSQSPSPKDIVLEYNLDVLKS